MKPMDIDQSKFMLAVLGETGSKALAKASATSSFMAQAIVPRTILSWVALAARYSYSGEVPGNPEYLMEFTKTESGFSGFVGDYSFVDQPVYHLAASLACAMDVTQELPNAFKVSDLNRLGKSVDLLVKSNMVRLLKKELDPNLGYHFQHEESTSPIHSLKINAFTPKGQHIGFATFHHNGPNIYAFGVGVDDEHQRQGLASHMYSMAEKMTGKKLTPSPIQTDEGKALWNGASKPFGKAEEVGLVAKPEAPGDPIKAAPANREQKKLPRMKLPKVPGIPPPKDDEKSTSSI
ncbi:NAT_SF domain containing protein [uncultured Caudovirales phage]|uniref:NAT_SF domain containing protein n=1 Tax=uncultured Caudovirales phage TaxID=2100421 RepID=A0A6J5L0T2_9CAUD|nr:NAT_SF domain containing protein [uncultured Caudovirales phage]